MLHKFINLPHITSMRGGSLMTNISSTHCYLKNKYLYVHIGYINQWRLGTILTLLVTLCDRKNRCNLTEQPLSIVPISSSFVRFNIVVCLPVNPCHSTSSWQPMVPSSPEPPPHPQLQSVWQIRTGRSAWDPPPLRLSRISLTR